MRSKLMRHTGSLFSCRY